MPSIIARILWPALGFPAVIAPRPGAPRDPGLSDATRTICVFVVSDQERLTRQDAARYLRCVPWHEKRRRHIEPKAPGSFSAEDLAVRNQVAKIGPPDDARLADAFRFGATDGGKNGISVSLARYVREFYDKQDLRHLHEIRLSEAAAATLRKGQYQLFWNTNNPGENKPSDEMSLLLSRYAEPLRRRELGREWNGWRAFFLNEYRYEYGISHPSTYPPYKPRDRAPRFTEVLHPVFIHGEAKSRIRIGHLTDTHIDVRNDVYERNLQTKGGPVSFANNRLAYKGRRLHFNNWNRNFELLYDDARGNSDILLLTGDLIDYGRGHLGTVEVSKHLGNDHYYHKDRNWFLFYYLLAGGGRYYKPAYTILGNHDWRLNPYPPFAPGAPGPQSFIHNHLQFVGPNGRDEDLKHILRIAHGEGHQKAYAYPLFANSKCEALVNYPWASLKTLAGRFKFPGSPVETTVESIAWYLLLVNPFLDYRFSLPGGHEFLMLDWARDEELWNPDEPKSFMGFGQRAERCLTSLQRWHVEDFTSTPGRARVIGIHAPPIGPYGHWYDEDILAGRKTYKRPEDSRVRRADGTILRLKEHPLAAVRRRTDPLGIAADHGSFVRHRDWFIRRLATGGVRAVLSGHLHRDGIYVAYESPAYRGGLLLGDLQGLGRPPNVLPYPLYVNTTSAGPRGGEYRKRFIEGRAPAVRCTRDPGYGLVTLSHDGEIQVASTIVPSGVGKAAC